jgi:AraC-like DNA-binding protein
MVFYHFQPPTFKLEIINRILNLEQPPEIFLLTLVIFAHILVYVISASLLIRRYTNQIKDNYSTINLTWLNNILRSLAYMVVISLLVSILQFYGEPFYFEIGLLVLMASIAVFLSSVLFRAFEEPQLLVYRQNGDKYRTSSLTTGEIDVIAAKIIEALEKNEIYLDPDTTISDLADQTGVHARQVSQVINQRFEQNFFELINNYRIKAAQKLIRDPADPKMTILEVMYKVGYNSKSSFNTQFKKFTGITPSEFKRLNR